MFIKSNDRNDSPLIREILRAPCSGMTGSATLTPSSRCMRIACSPMKSMNAEPQAKPCTATTHGRGAPGWRRTTADAVRLAS